MTRDGYTKRSMGAQTGSASGTDPASGTDSALLGDVVLPDRYRVVRRIARGGMGTVWCAEDLALGRRVAIKLLAGRFIDDEHAVRRFKREARTAARLSGHPNVVTIYDVGETAPAGDEPRGRPFIVMEYLAGGTVRDALRVGAVQREDAMRWITGAAAALDYAHGHGVVHRDIKPGNLLLDGDRMLHVADFGIATIGADDPTTGTGQLMGTAAYISPEQALGHPAADASDRYSLAVVAFELLAGERPFPGDHFSLQARQHIEKEPPQASSRNADLPAAVDPILIRGMAKQPGRRWPSAAAFAQALEGALRDQPTDPIIAARAPAAAVPAVAAPAPDAAPAGGEWTPRTTNRRRRRSSSTRPRRGAAIGAIGAAALAVGGVIVATGTTSNPHRRAEAAASGARQPSGTHRSASPAPTHKKPHHRPHHTTKPLVAAATAPSSGSTSTGTPSASTGTPSASTGTPPTTSSDAAVSRTSEATRTGTSTEAQTTTGTVASSPTAPPTADALEARGHQLMLDGQYSQAIGVLHQALAAASPGSLTYAYALYDLGRSLRLSGNPSSAVPVLKRRLRIPNQTGVVQHELNLARHALGRASGGAPAHGAGASTRASGGAAPAPSTRQKPARHGRHSA